MSKYIENLVLIPGLNNTKEMWNEVVEQLPKSVNCHPITVPAIADMDELAEEVLKELPEKFHLAGFSFGGFLALAILEKAPERVTGLALIGTSADGESEVARENRNKSIARAQSGEYKEMVAANAHRSFHPNNADNVELKKIREKMVEDYGAERFVAHATATMNRPDRNHLLVSNDIPYLFVGGKDDLVVPATKVKKMLEKVPTAQYEEVENTGHLIPLEQPEILVSKMLPWLKNKVTLNN
jgi:pimeloyl-ACP methyl ester carboxylesterase